jgi:type IV pilus assembly protein PilM
MLGLQRKPKQLLGIDVSSTSVKLVELAQTTGIAAPLYRVEAFAVEALPASAMAEKKISDIDAVGQSVRRAVATSGTRARHAAAAVPLSAVITKVIAMNASLSDAEMESQIQLDADQYIPYPLEEVNIDFDVLGPSDGNPDLVDVLVAASRRENVDDMVAALEIGGLRALIIDVEPYAMERAFALLDVAGDGQGEHTVAVADVGATTTTIQVLHDGRTVYTRAQNFGSNQLFEEIQRRYEIARLPAIDLLMTGGLPAPFESDVLGPFNETLAQQIGRALQFFYTASKFSSIDQIVLAGGATATPGLKGTVEERLGFPVLVASPFRFMEMAAGIDREALARTAPSMMIAAGLAMRTFD